MGADVPDAEIEAILSGLGFAPARSDVARVAPQNRPRPPGNAVARPGAEM